MKTVCETLGVARSNIAARAASSPSRARGRPPLPDRELVEHIKGIIADMPGKMGVRGPMPSASTG